jgi:radical SAM superfamily enzyme YgiQ (UPF0313 family)
MNVTLIRPRFAKGYQSPARMEPLALAILAALTSKEHKVRAVDERFEEVPFSEPTDLVAISACTFSAKRAYEIAANYRERSVPVVLGGFHPTLQPEEAMMHADAVVVGDAEATWPQVMADAVAGRLQRLYTPSSPGPAVAAMPDRSVFQGKNYLPIRLVQFGRGCPRACEFCSIHAFYGGGVRHRPVEAVVEELKACRARRVFFVDDNLLADRSAFHHLMEAILPLGLRWTSQMDLSIADNPDLLDLARRSGCQSMLIGFESLSENNLRQMGKAWNHVSSFVSRLARIRRLGIMVYGTFLFGYDEDDPGVFKRTLDFVLEQKFFIANFNPLQPFPGTPLYERLQKESRLVYERWWMEPGYRWQETLVRPKGMTTEQLAQGCRWARARFHSLAGITRRLPSRAHLGSLDNLAVYLASNWVSRREIRAKLRLQEAAP